MILVNAANGNQGKLLVPRLIEAGLAVRCVVRSERSAAELRAAGVADVIVGDMAKLEVIAQAMQGIEKVYYVCPGIHPLERETGIAWIDAAKAAGVTHFVFSSVLHPALTDLVQHEIKRDVEEHLMASDLAFTILQPSIYMAPRRMKAAFETGVFRAAWSLDRRQSLVDIGDVAHVAAMVLIDSAAHAAATYELVAPGRYTAHDVGAVLSGVMGRTIPVEEIGPEAYTEFLFGDVDKAKIPHQISAVQALHVCYSKHDFVGNPNVLTWLLGRTPTTFEQFVAAQFAVFEKSVAQA